MAVKIDYEELENHYITLSLPELTAEIHRLKTELDSRSASKTLIQKMYDHLTMAIVPDRMDDEGVSTMNVTGVGRLQVAANIRCSCPAPNKEALYKWLKDNNHAAMIQPTVNSSTLKAFVVEQMKEENGNYHKELLKFEPYSRATVVKI